VYMTLKYEPDDGADAGAADFGVDFAGSFAGRLCNAEFEDCKGLLKPRFTTVGRFCEDTAGKEATTASTLGAGTALLAAHSNVLGNRATPAVAAFAEPMAPSALGGLKASFRLDGACERFMLQVNAQLVAFGQRQFPLSLQLAITRGEFSTCLLAGT